MVITVTYDERTFTVSDYLQVDGDVPGVFTEYVLTLQSYGPSDGIASRFAIGELDALLKAKGIVAKVDIDEVWTNEQLFEPVDNADQRNAIY